MSRSDRDIQRLKEWALRLHEIEQQMEKLEAEAADLKARMRAWSPELMTPPARANGASDDGLRGGALTILRDHAGVEMDAETVARGLVALTSVDPDMASLRTTLSRLAREGHIERVRRGLYRAPASAAPSAVTSNGAGDPGREADSVH